MRHPQPWTHFTRDETDDLCLGLWVAKLIWPLMGLVVCTFIIIMGILFGTCRPYPRMWRFYTDEGGE